MPEDIGQCNNCLRTWRASELSQLKDVFERVLPGDIMPLGECPTCHAAVHTLGMEKPRAGDWLDTEIHDLLLLAHLGQKAVQATNPIPKDWTRILHNTTSDPVALTNKIELVLRHIYEFEP